MGIYEASVTLPLRASHAVAMPDGSMEAAHEHEWRITAAFRAPRLDASGFVIDFAAVRKALDAVADELSGRDLNEVLARPASAERLAEHIAGALAEKLGRPAHAVRVVEAPGCEAAFYPGGVA